MAGINRSQLLEQFGGDADLLRDVAAIFLGDYRARVEQLRRAIAAGDAGQLEISAHTLKGAASAFCASGVVEAARRLELLAREADFASASAALAQLEAELAQVLPELERAIRSAG